MEYLKEKWGTYFDRFLPGFLLDLSKRWVLQFNIYYDTDMLVLSLSLDPRCKLSAIVDIQTYNDVFSMVKTVAACYCAEIMKCGTDEEPAQAKRLAK